MKRLAITLAAALFAALSVSAQQGVTASILLDSPNSAGLRNVAADYINCRTGFKDRTPVSVSLGCIVQTDGSLLWSIDLTIAALSPFSIPDGGALLLKLADDSVITLNNVLDPWDTEDHVGTYNAAAHMTSYTMRAMYPVTEEQLETITGSAVTKIRIERSGNNIDAEYTKGDRIAAALAAQYALIRDTVSEQKDIYSDF